MRVVGIDTATSVASVALLENGHFVAEKIHPGHHSTNHLGIAGPSGNHAEIILPLIESVLQSAALSLTDLSGIAVSVGPGSFTGLRIGLSTVKGLSYGWGIPVVGISTLLANAERVTDHDGLICSILDARKNEVYASLFRKTADLLIRISDDFICSAMTVVDIVRSADGGESCLFIGDGTKVYGNLLMGSLGSKVRVSSGESYPSVATGVARSGQERFKRDDIDNLASLSPAYLRLPEAEFRRTNLL